MIRRVFLLIFITHLIFSCAKHDEKNKQFYRAIANQDTAYLSIIRLENKFYGQYEIRYNGKAFIDSGDVTGIIKKDTLRGTFHFKPYGGGEWRRKPIIFLEENGKLLLGKGFVHSFLKIAYFDETVPFDFSKPDFVFDEITE
ncbi:hypothetical protein ACRASX_00600 [Flavobacterium sp. TMP13]|uniref:hypothetical protein n=1 Tax=Flavobacterium sp. TMP13 TaxID=3425950 RepID=UPI003D788EB4